MAEWAQCLHVTVMWYDIGGHKSRGQLLKIFPQQRKHIKYANVA